MTQFYEDLQRLRDYEKREEEIMEQRELKKIEKEIVEANGQKYEDKEIKEYMVEGSPIMDKVIKTQELMKEQKKNLEKVDYMTFINAKRIENKENEVLYKIYELQELILSAVE